MSTNAARRIPIGWICPYIKLCSGPLSQQADLALQEAIRIAQESNDHVCLQHCLVKHPLLLLLMTRV